MDLPASYYGELDEKNPVILAFKRDINSFKTLMRQVSSSSNDDSSAYAKGIKVLVEIWKKYKHRLPSKLYQEHQLQIAEFFFGIKLYQPALWQGYHLHLLQFSAVKITDIKDVDRFMACFFPEGLDNDRDVLNMKIRAMQGCALCMFELEKQHNILSQEALAKLLRILDFIRIMMQAFQQHEHLYKHIYNGALHIYNICRYLMTMKHSAKALEYLLWASIILELSIPLMTAKYLPLIVTLYCAVCHCYYDNNADTQAQTFASRARGKINDLSKLEDQSDVPTTRETQRAYKEAFIKLDAMIFKRAVFQSRRYSVVSGMKTKRTLKDIPNLPWPRTPVEHLLEDTFDCSAGHFLGILEALWDSKTRPLQMTVPDTPELLEVVLELMSAGIYILSGVTSTDMQKYDDHPYPSPAVLTSRSTLLDFAIIGENKVPILSAVRFIKLLFHYKQFDVFTKLAREILQVLSGMEGPSFRKAELELTLLDSFKILKGSHLRESNMNDDRHKPSFCVNDDFTGLVHTLHKSVCGTARETQPSDDLVLDIVLYLWGKMRAVIKRDHLQTTEFPHSLQKIDHYDKWMWCLSMLCEVAISCDLAAVDFIMTAEMFHSLGFLLETAAEKSACEGDFDGMQPGLLPVLESSSTELLQKVCEVVRRGVEALEKGVAMLLPQDCSAFIDSAFMQKFSSLRSTASSNEVGNEEDGISLKEKEDSKVWGRTKPSCMFLLAKDLHLELQIIFYRAFLKLLHLNAVAETELLNRIKKNKVSKALFLIQKALLTYKYMKQNDSSTTKCLLEKASNLIEKAEMEERKVFTMSSIHKTPADTKGKGMKVEKENPPPPPILCSRTDHSMTFAPAPYNLEAEVCWYQICGRVAEGANQKVHLRDCNLSGTGNMVPAVCGECVLRVDGLEPNQKYVFAVAAYNSQGKLLGNTIGGTTLPLLASMPVPLLYTWAHLAQVAFQTEQYTIAKRACSELWSHYTTSKSTQDQFTAAGLQKQTLQHSSPQLCQLFLTSIFIETAINTHQLSLCCDSFSPTGPFIWEQESRMAECKRMLVTMDFAKCLNNGSIVMQAVVTCYGLLVPLIFYQITWDPVIQVLTRCLTVLEENSGLLKQKWNKNTSESIMHMVACITYYLSKALRVLRSHQMAAEVMESGRRLLQEIYDVQIERSKAGDHVAAKGGMKISLELKALHGKKGVTSEAAVTTDNEMSWPLAACDDLTILYDLISSSTLMDAYQDVLKLKKKTFFIEFAALLLQRTMEEGHPQLVLEWGQSIFQIISRRDRVLVQNIKCVKVISLNKRRGSSHAPKGNELIQNKNTPDDIRKKLKEKLPQSMFRKLLTNRERRFVENMLTMMSSLVQHRKKRLRLRNLCCVERAWRAHINYTVAQAHLAQLYQGLDKLYGGTPQHRYSQFNPLYFSLAYSGVLVWRNSQEHQSPESKVVLEKDLLHSGDKDCATSVDKAQDNREVEDDDSVTEGSSEEGEDSSQTVEPHLEAERINAAFLQDSLNKAAVLLRRAMVLAHRGSHWTTLQCVCQTMWDQNCRISSLVQSTVQVKTPCPITADQLDEVFTPLLVLATDLIMDMLNKLELWSLYDSDLTEEEFESSLHLSVPLDDNTQVDFRWVRTLVLYTLERLHNNRKWETLAHNGLLFNSYTRERYTLIITPLLVHAQRTLLEQISSFGGPAVPQPHHVKTQKATGKEVTCRSYAGCQLLSGWTPHPAQQQTTHKKARLTLTDFTPQEVVKLKDAEIQNSMSLVCVPLDVEDTLNCYHQALKKRPHCLHVFQHSRTLLLQLLAFTQPSFVWQVPHSPNRGLSQSSSLVNFSPILMPTPNIQPCDLTEEDYSTLNAIYMPPMSPDHISTVTAAYSLSIKYLQANSHVSLRVLALHELGNLQFYNGNTQSALSCWSKAVDVALQSSDALEKFDGMSFGDGSPQQILKQAGLWGCLQAAVLTAKIAQYVLNSDINQRTKCCLFSAYLFKCLLCCSMAYPHDDLQYASYIIEDELLPGVDLFSEPHRLHLGTTVMSLQFICHWLFTTGYYIKLLPIIAIYLHFAGTVCRDVKRTVEGKLLKIRALTELCLFTEAVNETVLFTQGAGVLLPYGHYITKAGLQHVKTFYCNKPLVDNVEALEELVKCDFASEICTLYGPTLCIKFNLARIQLILAFANTIQGHPLAGLYEGVQDACARVSSLGNSKPDDQDKPDTEGSSPKPEVLIFDTEKENLTPERIKFLLLEEASILLDSLSQQLTSTSCMKTENLELTIESNLLKANLHLQQGHAALSCEMAISSLMLLQTSTLTGSIQGSQKYDAKDCSVSNIPYEDCPRAVEAFERIGVSLWLRCRLALVQGLTADIPGTAVLFPGKNTNEEAAKVLQEGLDECSLWGDLDVQALLMVEGADLDAQRGKTDDSMAKLQEAVSLLSGRTYMPSGSTVTLARATLLLSELKGVQSTTLLQLTQKLLKKQLCVFGQGNIYLPYLTMLHQITERIDAVLHLHSLCCPLVDKQRSSS
ncbi:cilia- and flagella-associated protein 54 [Parambassis ranga]|uniref:Cilia- and flagella-associated protein 54 n=1 Tax=Parambassis ranga TaxID=210632 RepID=A0A6P7JM83_9TELE|nr:cilia- and flagella-associated protein 54 [Parambassis ranga]